MRVNLTDSELLVCRLLGVMRRSAAMNNVTDQQVGEKDTWEMDVDGVVGELCAAKRLNVCPDLTIGIRSGGHDLISKTKQTVDVKTTRVKNGRLLATLDKIDKSCDIYVLVIVDDFGGDVVGWASKEEFLIDANIKDLGHGPGYALSQEKLNKL